MQGRASPLSVIFSKAVELKPHISIMKSIAMLRLNGVGRGQDPFFGYTQCHCIVWLFVLSCFLVCFPFFGRGGGRQLRCILVTKRLFYTESQKLQETSVKLGRQKFQLDPPQKKKNGISCSASPGLHA